MGVRVKKRGQSWTVHVYDQGQRKAKACKTRADAEQLPLEIRRAQARGTFGLQAQETARTLIFQEATEKWLERYAKRHRRPSTYEGYAR